MDRASLTEFTFGSLILWLSIAERLWSIGYKTLIADIWHGVFIIDVLIICMLWGVETWR